MPFNIGGGFSSSKSKSSGTESVTAKSSTTRLSEQRRAWLDEMIGTLGSQLSGSGKYTKESAMVDSAGLVEEIFNKYRKEVPQIVGKQTMAGAYGSTGAQSFANEAFARTNQLARASILDTISKYADIENSERTTSGNQLNALLQSLLNAQETTDSSSYTKSSSKSKGSSVGVSGGFAGGK